MTINNFRGEYAFLSNFYVEADGFTIEHYFQADKTDSEVWKTRIMEAKTPTEAKRLGRRTPMIREWDYGANLRLSSMRFRVWEKFKDPVLRQKLLDTQDEELVEGNTWGDRYWGVDIRTGIGENWLGKILMETRMKIRRNQDAGMADRQGSTGG